jgi:hypothetical protein
MPTKTDPSLFIPVVIYMFRLPDLLIGDYLLFSRLKLVQT